MSDVRCPQSGIRSPYSVSLGVMSTLLVKNARMLATMDDERREIPDAGLYATDGFIDQVGPTSELPETADEVVDLSDHLVFPGLVNTHHHFYQTLTRAVPAAQDRHPQAGVPPRWCRKGRSGQARLLDNV